MSVLFLSDPKIDSTHKFLPNLIWEDWSLDIYKKSSKRLEKWKKKYVEGLIYRHKKCLFLVVCHLFLPWLFSLVLMLKTQAGSCFIIAKFQFKCQKYLHVTISIIWKSKSLLLEICLQTHPCIQYVYCMSIS